MLTIDSNYRGYKDSLSYIAENSSVHPFPALWQASTLNPMRRDSLDRKSVPIDAMLNLMLRKLLNFGTISCKVT